MSPARRLPAALALVAVLAGAFLLDAVRRPAPERDTSFAEATSMPTAAPARALSSTWFCAGGTGAAGGAADAGIVVVNTAPADVTAVVTVVGSKGEPARRDLEVPGRSRASLRLGDVVAAPYVAATVDVPAGAVAVEQGVNGQLGVSLSPCSSFGSDRWFVPDGSTAREDKMVLALYNPFPEDAIVDLSFSTDEGRAVPAALQGILVKGGRLVPVNVGNHVRRRNRVAATVTTRSGRVVVDRLQLRNGATKGLSVVLAAPSTQQTWWLPDGLVADGITERYSIYNPSGREAVVSLELVLAEGAAEPFDLTIPARDRVDVDAGDAERVPRNVAHAAVVRSQNGVGVVVERSVAAAAPSPRRGVSEVLGSPRTARRWVFGAGSATDTVDEWITVVNPNPTAVRLSVTALAAGQPLPVERLQDVEVGAGRRVSYRLTDHLKRDDLPLLVEATGGEVVVERAVYMVGSPGISFAPGVPLR